MGNVRTVEPTTTPVTLTEAKLWLRVDHDGEDGLIYDLIEAATKTFEQETDRQLVTATYQQSFTGFGCGCRIKLQTSPLLGVSSVSYLDSSGVEQTLSPSVYGVDLYSEPGSIYLEYQQTYPAYLYQINSVVVEYTAGYGVPDDYSNPIPANIRAALKAMILHNYLNRSAVEVGTIATEVPMGVRRVMELYKVVQFV